MKIDDDDDEKILINSRLIYCMVLNVYIKIKFWLTIIIDDDNGKETFIDDDDDDEQKKNLNDFKKQNIIGKCLSSLYNYSLCLSVCVFYGNFHLV